MTTELAQCPQCRARYVPSVGTCADCGVRLEGGPLDPDPTDEIDFVEDPFDEDEEVIAIDLSEWEPHERAQAEGLLVDAGIRHAWDPDDDEDEDEPGAAQSPWLHWSQLVVLAEQDERVEALLDQVEHPMALDVVEDDGEEDQDAFEVIAGLYDAVDRLSANPRSAGAAEALVEAERAASVAEAAYGIDPQWWSATQAEARAAALAIGGGDEDELRRLARALRERLRPYV